MVRAGLVLATSEFEARALTTRPRGLPAQWSKGKSHFHHFYAFYGKMKMVKFRVYIYFRILPLQNHWQARKFPYLIGLPSGFVRAIKMKKHLAGCTSHLY